MIPELELDDIRPGTMPCDILDIPGENNLTAMRRNLIGIAPVTRLFEQQVGLTHIRRHDGPYRSMGLADPAAQMGRHMQDMHYSAATCGRIFSPPGAGTAGLIFTLARNFSKSMSR